MIRLSPQVRFKLKTQENSIQKFFLGLNHGAKQVRNTKDVTMTLFHLIPLNSLFFLNGKAADYILSITDPFVFLQWEHMCVFDWQNMLFFP